MEYPLMTPPFEIKPFKKMTKKEAQIHFEWYICEVPERVELVRRAYFETGGGNLENLDFSPQSLINLWTWFIPRINTIIRSEEEIEEEIKKVPDWLKGKVPEDKQKLSVGSLSLAMDIAIYFGEVFIGNFDKLYWGFVTKPKSSASVNRPVIMGFSTGIELDPRILVHNLTFNVINGNTDKESLFNLYQVWKDDI
ncbi:hypothetical protein [Cytobacillus horneckiae]|uniref:hypothetical protein n=1 Tax=Cytobacillus horneckiae TaxID=549687 RepID=UPI003D9A5AFC